MSDKKTELLLCPLCRREVDTGYSTTTQRNSRSQYPGQDGTERLCQAVYHRHATPRDYLGGSEANMLHDAADEIARLRAELSNRKVDARPDPARSMDRGSGA